MRTLTVWHLARRELRAHVNHARFLILAAVATLLVPLAVYSTTRDFVTKLDTFHAAERQRRLDESASGGALLGRQAEPALQVLRPPEPNSILVQGVDRALPVSWAFGPAGIQSRSPSLARQQVTEPATPLDLSFILRIVLGLLAITMAGDALAGERSSGMLQTLLSQPVSATTVFLAKLLGGLAALLVLLVFLLFSATVALAVWAATYVSRDVWLTLLLVTGSALLYATAMYALGLVIAAFVTSHQAVSVLTVTVWLILTLGMPPMSAFVASVLAKTPALEAAEREQQEVFDARRGRDERAIGDLFVQIAGGRDDWSRAEADPVVIRQIESAWTERATAARVEDRASDTRNQAVVNRQRSVSFAINMLTPATLLDELTSAVAGTGTDHAVRWEDATRDYQRYLEQVLFDDPPRMYFLAPRDLGRAIRFVAIHSVPKVDGLQAFAAPTEPLRHRLRDASAATGGLLLFIGLASSLALIRFRRTAVR